ncbi:MAG: ferrochelatase [Veillonella caviae]|nr:ferrochelatase [Veillonella caviae]
MKQRMGLLVMAYGTPRSEADILPYYTNIRRGYPPTEEEVTTLTKRYAAIGGLSPLAKLTELQAQELVKQLNERSTRYEFELFIGNKHIEPSIEEAVSRMAEAGIEEAVAIVMAPYFSIFATASYFERAQRRAKRYGMKIHEVQAWNEEPQFVAYWVNALKVTLQEVTNPESVAVVFTAHSLPYHVIHMGDTYPQMVEATAHGIAEAAGIDHYYMAWQSAGVRGDWLTPDVEAVTQEVAAKTEAQTVIYVPIGFVCDHLEVLYDNDIVCKDLCEHLGLQYTRVPMPNGNPLFVEAMTQAVRRLAKSNEVK